MKDRILDFLFDCITEINWKTVFLIMGLLLVISSITGRIIYDVWFYHEELQTCVSNLNTVQSAKENAEAYADQMERQNNRSL